MKTKFITLILAGSFFSVTASAQTIRENIDKAAKDKNTMDRSAKADVLIQKRTIADSSQIKITPVKVVTKTYAVTQKNTKSKKKYKVKRRSSSK